MSTGVEPAAGAAAVPPRFECGVCWHVYDPAEGDPARDAPPGTAFDALPEGWTCPRCDAPREKFLRLDDGR